MRKKSIPINPIMKLFFVTASINSLALGLTMPFLAVFASSSIKGGDIQVASIATAISPFAHAVAPVGGWLLDRYLKKKNILPFYFFTTRHLAGAVYLLLMAFVNFPLHLYLLQGAYGIIGGLTLPATPFIQNKLMDKNKEGEEWGISQAIFFIATGMGAIIAGVVIKHLGFQVLFFAGAFTFLVASIASWKTMRAYKARASTKN